MAIRGGDCRLKTAFVILHFGDLSVTKRCVDSIESMDGSAMASIVIVDNEYKKPHSERVEACDFFGENAENRFLIQVTENGGFSYANNKGYSFARSELGADVIVVLNNDIEFVQADFLEKVSSLVEESDYDVVGPDVVKASTFEHQNPMALTERTVSEVSQTIRLNTVALKLYPLLFPLLLIRERRAARRRLGVRGGWQENSATENPVLFGACLIFLPGFVENERLAFEPETHFYYEEYILAHRCALLGYRTACVFDIQVLHESGKSTEDAHTTDRKRLRFMMENIVASARIYRDYLRSNPLCEKERKRIGEE